MFRPLSGIHLMLFPRRLPLSFAPEGGLLGLCEWSADCWSFLAPGVFFDSQIGRVPLVVPLWGVVLSVK